MTEVNKNKLEAEEAVTVPPEKIFHIKLIGYESTGDAKFFERLKALLKKHGFNLEDLFYSGFDGTDIDNGIPRYPYIFGMNEPGIIDAIKFGDENPAQFAQHFKEWCIGVYDKKGLVEPYSYEVDQELGCVDEAYQDTEPYLERVKLINIKYGIPLTELDPGQPVAEAVIHKDYPKGSPTDCLLCIVIIDQD